MNQKHTVSTLVSSTVYEKIFLMCLNYIIPDNTDKNIVLESIVKGERYVLNFSKIPFDTEKPER